MEPNLEYLFNWLYISKTKFYRVLSFLGSEMNLYS